MYKYEAMRETLDKRIPEILKTERYTEMIKLWGDTEIPTYCYYETLEHLFIDLLNGDVKDDKLLERILDFMEDMANSEDEEVQHLLVVQILEGLFGLDYDVFSRMQYKLLRPKTLTHLLRLKGYFRWPEPPECNRKV